MDRRHYPGGDPFYGSRGFPGMASPFYPVAATHRSDEEDLIARSREWMSRQEDKSRDPWRRSVDDFLDDRNGRYKSSRDRRESRSRSRDRKRRSSRERSSRGSSRDRERSRRSPNDEDSRDHSKRYDRSDRYDYDRGSRHDRYERRFNRDNEDENSKKYSSEEETSNGYDMSDNDAESRPYADIFLKAEERFAYKKQTPQKTIIIRGLAQHITEHDIQEDIILSQLQCRDIRLVRRKDTGTSRGFAFVEFKTVEDATKWIELKQGEIMVKGNFRALLQYSLPKNHVLRTNCKSLSDWYCKCRAHNFRRRDTCFKCNLTRKEGEVLEGTDEVSSHPTNTVLLRGLDTLTTEESVLQSIKTLSSLPIRSVRIGRDIATNMSRGVCYLEMNSVVDAMYLHNALQSHPVIDGRTAIISYAKLDPLMLHSSAALSGQIANAAVAAAQWSHQKSETTSYKLSDVPRLAEYSANLYATNPQEKTAYLNYYEEYYKKQITEGGNITLPDNSSAGLACAQAAVSAHKKANSKNPLTDAPDGSGDRTYPTPDVSSYQYDKSSGYYYDPYTTLYYDANSQYYYNNRTGKFLYWDASKSTYLPAPTDGNNVVQGTQAPPPPEHNNEENSKDDDKKSKDKDNEKDKVKVAKRIAKDMERWAKTLNQKKEIAKQNIVAAQQAVSNLKAAGAADIGYAVLERKDLSLPMLANGIDNIGKNESLVAAYGQGSDSEEDTNDPENSQDAKNLTDWSKLACLLCKRQFPSKDVLIKHQQLSDLHKQNLNAYYKSKHGDQEEHQLRYSNMQMQYRDRAKERRLKYGEPDAPQPSKLKETYMKGKEAIVSYEEPTKAGIGSDNLGSKLLQKMGWQEGMGLGKTNQGRTSIIQTDRRAASAGLGTKTVGVTPGPGETYKDCVKKMMQIRYSEIDGNS